MDLTQCDAFAKALAAPTSRRQALKTLTATAAGGKLGLSAIGTALATRQEQRSPLLFGAIEIAARGGGLVLAQGPTKAVFPLTHFDRDVFVYQPVGENAYGLTGVTFTVGAGGKATSVVVENLDKHGQGTFTRE